MADSEPSSPVRVAVRIADGPVPAFQVAAIEGVLGVADVEVVLVLIPDAIRERTTERGRTVAWLESAYGWLECRTLRGGPSSMTPRSDWRWSATLPVVRQAPHQEQVDALTIAGVDVVLDLASRDGPLDLPIPPLGWWRLRYAVGVGRSRRHELTRPHAAAELAESLLSVTLPSGQEIETEAGVSTLRRVGYARDRDAILWRSALLPARRLTRLLAGVAAGPNPHDRPRIWGVEPDRSTNRGGILPPFGKLAMTLISKAIDRVVFRTSWFVAIRRREPDQGPPHDLSGFQPIKAPANRFYADPFVVTMPDGPRLYVEDCPDGAHRGRISTLRRGEDEQWVFEQVVLDDLAHRAYPHVLRTDAGLVVTPDGGRNGGVDLFLASGPDGALERIGACLQDVPASDPTLLWHEGRYWLFVTVTGHGMSPWDELHLFSAAHLTDLWEPHAQNPVVADVRCARPAGRIFDHEGAMIRPGQDCSLEYGRRIVLSTIVTLTPQTYEERPIGTIEPQGLPGLRRTHTYTFDASIEALDGYHRVRRRPHWLGARW